MAEVTGTYYEGNADIGYGSELLVGQDDGSPETFVALSDVIEVNLGGFNAEIIPKTHLRSPGRAQEKLTGLRDFENITVRCNYNRFHGSHKNAGGDGFTNGGMRALHRRQDQRNFLALVGSSTPQEEIPIRGVVSGITQPVIGVSGKLEITYTITPLHDYIADLD